MTGNGVQTHGNGLVGGPNVNMPVDQMEIPPGMNVQHQALQVLTMAQRTAEEHLAGARGKADTICGEARAKADQIVREAQSQAQVLQQEAEKTLAEAHNKTSQIARDAQIHADTTQRKVEETLTDARNRADEMARKAKANADELMLQARQRYEDVVGSLASKREALQQQIEALEEFDREYRNRFTQFMQAQMRSLWADRPRVTAGEIEDRTVDAEASEDESVQEAEQVEPEAEQVEQRPDQKS